ncbi:hypothetical protein ACFX2I_021354 [Malus domestica]
MDGNKDSTSSSTQPTSRFFGRGERGTRCSSNAKSFIFTVDLYATIAAEIAPPPQNAPSRTCKGYGSTSSSERYVGESSTAARSATKNRWERGVLTSILSCARGHMVNIIGTFSMVLAPSH